MSPIVLLAACADPVSDLPKPLLNGPEFFDSPWPSDTRLLPDGGLDVTDFPNPFSNSLLDRYLGFVQTRQGAGPNAPIYVRFDDLIDVSKLPTPDASLAPDSAVQLFNIDPTSPGFLHKVPIQFEWSAEPTNYEPGNLLATAPLFGWPLRPATRHALIVTTALANRADGMDEAFSPRDNASDPFRDLLAALPLIDLKADDIAIATVFTTADPLEEMSRLVRFLREDVGLPDLNLDVDLINTFTDHTVWRTHYPGPRFTHGERPYLAEGGNFEFRADGQPVLDGWDDMRLAVCVPNNPNKAPEGGWPVVIQQHGTGGDYLSHCNGSQDLEIARQLGNRGFVSLGLDHPLHGTRNGGTPPSDLANFNLFNPEGATTNFRQGALDALYLARALRENGANFTMPDGSAVPIDGESVYFFGHSQGGLTGALAAPWFGGDAHAAVLSGAGGTLAITIVDRKDVLDFAQLVSDALQFADNETVTELHPVVGLIQTAVEVTDPVNYAPYWFHLQPPMEGAAPIDVLMTTGTLDLATPYRTHVALAAAGRVPVLAPGATDEFVFRLRGTAEREGPLGLDVVAWDGTRGTAGVAQWRGEDHFLVFDLPIAADVYGLFLETADEGVAVVARPKDVK